MEFPEKTIDIEKVIRGSENKLLRSLPGFAIMMLRRLVREDEMNYAINRSSHLEGVPFVKNVLEGWNVKVIIKGRENLPSDSRIILAANHPVGGIDAMSFFGAIGDVYPDIISPANELLWHIPNMRPLIFGLNVFGKTSRETAVKLNELYNGPRPVFIFPAGEVSRRKKGVISDNPWQKSFISKAIEHKRDIIPVHISGRNSSLFYTVASLRTLLGIKMFIETILLPREMIKQGNSLVTITIGKPIEWESLDNEKSHNEWAELIRKEVYSLA